MGMGCVSTAITTFLLLLPAAHGWGKEGHYAVCRIAEIYFTHNAMAAVKSLLPDSAEGDLASVCSWADDVRKLPPYRWSSPLHFADTPDYSCDYQYLRDCHDSAGNKNRCVTGAINNYTMQLKSWNHDPDLSLLKYNLTEALMFLSHFIGDVHQPLHIGFLGDVGGNTITVEWYQTKTNLHRVWDDMIIESALEKFYNSDISVMIQSIMNDILDGYIDTSSWQSCNETVCPDIYASESIDLACKYAYRNATPGSTLGDDYFLSRRPVVETRIAQSGVRLGGIINDLFASYTPPLVAQE